MTTVVIELRDEEARALAAKARERGVSAEQYARQILRLDLEQEPKKPLSARIRDLWADMPSHIRAKLPADGASEVDHYVYGLPKRGE
jgi:hypothetical protein